MLLSAVLLGACSDSDDDSRPAGSLNVKAVSAESHALKFDIAASQLERCAYLCVKADEAPIPAHEILVSGKSVNPKTTTTVTVEGLTSSTDYKIYVAGEVGGQLLEQSLLMTTARAERTLTHTVLLYMMGNNGLVKYMDNNLSKIKSVAGQIPEHGRLMVFYDRGNYTNLTEIYRDESTGRVKQRIVKEYAPATTSSVDPEFMEGVFREVMAQSPTDTYGLVFSSHGGGWVPSDIFDLYLTDRGRSAVRPLYFGQDGPDCMEIADLAEVLGKFHFDYIIFDACFMASVEALYDLRNTTPTIIASVAAIMGAGFPYKEVLHLLYTEDHGLKQICEAFMDFYKDLSGTISLIDTQHLATLAEQMRRVVAAGTEPASVDHIQAYEGFKSHLYFDLEQYVESLTHDAALLSDFRAALHRAVPYTAHTSTVYTDYVVRGETNHFLPLPRSCGLSCHINQAAFPETHAAYLETEWAKKVGSK